KEGSTDPILFVVGCREYLLGSSRENDLCRPFQHTSVLVEREMQHYIREWCTHWEMRLPADKRVLRLRDLYLTLELQDFGQEDTQNYLLKLGEEKQTRVFADNTVLVQRIDRL